MKEHGICAKCKKSVGCPYANDRITGCKNFVLEPELRLTNEESLRQCNTEQVAELLDKMTLSCYICGQDGYNENPRHCIFGRCTGKEDIFEWLKKPHKE